MPPLRVLAAFCQSMPLATARRVPNLNTNSYHTAPRTKPWSCAQPPSPRKRPASAAPSRNKRARPRPNNRQIRQLFAQAKAAEAASDVPAARALLQRCLSLDERDAHSWLALARLEARAPRSATGQDPSAAARDLFRRGLHACPDNVHLLQAWAVHEHRCGRREPARDLFAKALAIQPQNAYVCQAWGLLEQRVGNNDKARELFRRSASARPHPQLCLAWAVLEARAGNIQTARDLFRRGLDACTSGDSGSIADIYCAWADMEQRVGDMPRARSLLSKAISAHPHLSDAYVALGRLEARRGGTVRALELMRAAASLSPQSSASVYNHWAQIEWQHCGRTSEARALLEKGLALHPRDPALLQTLGTLEDKLGNTEAAKKFFAASVEARPTAPALVAWALLEEREGDCERSKALFEEALDANKLHGAAYNAYGMMEARRGCLDAARAVYDRGVEANSSASVWHGYGQLELKIARKPDRARELFRRGTAHTSEDSVFVWHSWGMLELSEKQVPEAREVFKNALKRYPRNSRLLVGAAMADAASCNTIRANEHRAREFFRRAIAADPSHAHAWQAWGVFELRQGREDAAQALFRRGLRLCPGHGALWQAWGVLETSRGNFAKARQLFERGAQACPVHVHLYQAWACMEVQAGNVEKARKLLDLALEADSSDGPVWNAYGLLEARHGTIARARQNFMTGIRRAPHHAPIYRAFGQTEARAGNYERARKLFEEGLRVNPRHAPLYHALAKFEGMIGNVTGLADLKQKAEKYFSTEAEAVRVMECGEEIVPTDESAIADEADDDRYAANSTPMELALNCEPTVVKSDPEL